MSKNEKKEPKEHQKEPKKGVAPIGVSFEVFPTTQPTPRYTQGQDSSRKENS